MGFIFHIARRRIVFWKQCTQTPVATNFKSGYIAGNQSQTDCMGTAQVLFPLALATHLPSPPSALLSFFAIQATAVFNRELSSTCTLQLHSNLSTTTARNSLNAFSTKVHQLCTCSWINSLLFRQKIDLTLLIPIISYA